MIPVDKLAALKARVLRPLRDWFPESYWRAEQRRIDSAYDKHIQSAELSNEHHLSDDARWARDEEIEEPSEIVFWFDCKHLLKRAAKVDISLSDIPIPPGGSYWRDAPARSLLVPEAFRELRRRVLSAEREHRNDRRETMKLIAALLAGLTGVIGALAGLIAIVRKK